MPLLFESLRDSVSDWRRNGYVCDDYPLIGEILTYQLEGQDDDISLKYLREPQFSALEVYWYVRLIENTPHIIDLYKHYYEEDKEEFFEALGVPLSQDAIDFAKIEDVLEKIKTDEEFVSSNRIQPLHETLKLEYPSYILALAMGAGKTVLIGAIIATEFAMSFKYPEGNFMKNALVFAPGTTIIESLRELSDIPYEKMLPPNLKNDFLVNLKIEYPGAGKNVQAQPGSVYNMIVTNTEKISLRANRRKNQDQLAFKREELEANQRLQKIASLPNIGIFSDEAHHTYGNTFKQIKRVRETINYINEETNIVAVVNTTGTPYYKKQPLKEVIFWYGLGDGIRDNILKDLNNGIHQYDIQDQSEEVVFNDVIKEFFDSYGSVSLPDGAKAKIAFYFKTQEHLDVSRNLIERAMAKIQEDISQILVNTQKSPKSEIDEFNRLNNPENQKRVILLIGKGIEGWNCPSLFACALIKEQTTSNNYVLQAATRCLRQISGNTNSAKIFLDFSNAKILDNELADNFGTDLGSLSGQGAEKKVVTVEIRKPDLPKLETTRIIEKVVKKQSAVRKVKLEIPPEQNIPPILKSIMTPNFNKSYEMLTPTGEVEELDIPVEKIDCHTAARKIATRYHLPISDIWGQLKNLYPTGEIPETHILGLFEQVEKLQADYEIIEEEVTEAIALIRILDEDGNENFEKNDKGVYIHHLRMLKRTYERMKQGRLFADFSDFQDEHNLSFHYSPYNFDSKPERSLFSQVLNLLNVKPEDVEAFLFMGGLTDPKKTDFHFEYLGEDSRYHRYFPDFVLIKRTGEYYIIEVKSDREKGSPNVKAKEKAIKALENLELNKDKFKYRIVYATTSEINASELKPIREWVNS